MLSFVEGLLGAYNRVNYSETEDLLLCGGC